MGGGVAGLSAALVLGRACRNALLIDEGRQSNLPAPAVGGLIDWEGPPAALYAEVRDQLGRYPDVTLAEGAVTGLDHMTGGFAVTLADGQRVRAGRVLIATGMEYRYPDVPGLAELWGGVVFHCPYCHGWELRNRSLGVLGGDDHDVHRALLLREWTPDVVLLTGGPPSHSATAAAALAAAGIPVMREPVERLERRDGGLDVVLAGCERRPLDGLLVDAPMRRRTDLGLSLGVAVNPGGDLAIGDDFQTAVPGLYAAGDVASRHGQVIIAAAAGARAAMEIHASLVDERWGWSPSDPEERGAHEAAEGAAASR